MHLARRTPLMSGSPGRQARSGSCARRSACRCVAARAGRPCSGEKVRGPYAALPATAPPVRLRVVYPMLARSRVDAGREGLVAGHGVQGVTWLCVARTCPASEGPPRLRFGERRRGDCRGPAGVAPAICRVGSVPARGPCRVDTPQGAAARRSSGKRRSALGLTTDRVALASGSRRADEVSIVERLVGSQSWASKNPEPEASGWVSSGDTRP